MRWSWTMAAAMLVSLPAVALAAPKMERVGLEARIASQERSEGGLLLRLDARERCVVEASPAPRPVPCSRWAPLGPEDPRKKLSWRGEIHVQGKSRTVTLHANQRHAESIVVQARRGEADGVELRPARPGRWLLPAGAIAAWSLDPDTTGAVAVEILAGDAVIHAPEGSPIDLPRDDVGPATCPGLDWLADHWQAGGLGPASLASLDASACPDSLEAARAASCDELPDLGHRLALWGDPEQLDALRADASALLDACPNAAEALQRAGGRARDFLVTTQSAPRLIRLALSWGPLLGDAWTAETRRAGADAAMQQARRDGDTAPLLSFLAALPDSPEGEPVAREVLKLSARLELPCGQRRGCPKLPTGAVLSASWTDIPGHPAAPRLMAWSRESGVVTLQDALGTWAEGARPEELEAVAAALQGQASPGAWSLSLPFPLRTLPGGFDGYALELRPEGGEAVRLTFTVDAALGPFAGGSRAICVRPDGVDRIDEPGAAPLPLVSTALAPLSAVIQGGALYSWTSWTPEEGLVGPSPPSLIRVDLAVGGAKTVLSDEPVAEARSTPEGLWLRLGPGCSEEAARVAGTDGGTCRTALLTSEGLVDAPESPPQPPSPPTPTGPEGLSLVTDDVAGTQELFAVEQATGRRQQLSRAHILGRDFVAPPGCTAASGFSTRWYADGRLLVHQSLARCGDELRGPLLLVDASDGSSVLVAGSTAGIPPWVDRSWTADRGALLAPDGSIVIGDTVYPGEPGVQNAFWYRPPLLKVLGRP